MSSNSEYLIKLQYIIKIPLAGESIPLTWPNSHDKRAVQAISVFNTIVKLQKDIAEIFCSKEFSVLSRMRGFLDGYQIDFIESFDELKNSPYLFKIIFVDEEPESDLIDIGTIIVLCNESSECKLAHIMLAELNPKTLKRRLLEKIPFLNGPTQRIFDQIKSNLICEEGFSYIRTDFDAEEGIYNRANLAVLESLRVLIRRNHADCAYNREDLSFFVNIIDHVKSDISSNLSEGPIACAVDYYISDMSSSLEFATNRKNYSEGALVRRSVSDPKAMIAALKYSNRGLVVSKDSGNPYIADLEQERSFIDSITALSAASIASPIIKIQLNNSDIYPLVRNLSDVDRSSGRKVHDMMDKLRRLLVVHMGYWMEKLETSPSAGIKIISNLPLEWSFHQGLPMIVRHEVSRIPVTPGYVASKLLLDNRNIHISMDAFKEILIISSFAEDDPIRNDLKSSIEVIQKLVNPQLELEGFIKKGFIPDHPEIRVTEDGSGALDIKIKWIDVANKSELIKAINDNKSAITVFDLHGSHGIDGGLIHLKDEAVSVFDICRDISPSPIVILSTCDTSPVDKGHRSTAEAFFLAGAKTLISSALPIKSDLASTFLARLLVRIRHYLPARLRPGSEPLRWSTFVSGMIRRSYYLELLNLLQKRLKFDDKLKYNVIFAIGLRIDPLSPGWVKEAKGEITSRLGITEAYLDSFVEKNAQFTECMKYFQIGRPESIIIHAD